MNLCRCDKGHFYDKEKYASCPHCAGGSAADNRLTEAFAGDATMAMTQTDADLPEKPILPRETEQYEMTDLPLPGKMADEETVMDYHPQIDTKTVSLEDPFVQSQASPGRMEVDDDSHTIGYFDDIFELPPTLPKAGSVRPVKKETLAVNKVRTPCVGWLVALSGEHIGMDFRLKVGKNFIGRGGHMDVALTEDKSVSRDRHAIVVYEPKAHLYLVQPGESSSLVYKNDEVVLAPIKLEAYDVITVGNVDLLFMPLCGVRFNWGDFLKKMRNEDE